MRCVRISAWVRPEQQSSGKDAVQSVRWEKERYMIKESLIGRWMNWMNKA